MRLPTEGCGFAVGAAPPGSGRISTTGGPVRRSVGGGGSTCVVNALGAPGATGAARGALLRPRKKPMPPASSTGRPAAAAIGHQGGSGRRLQAAVTSAGTSSSTRVRSSGGGAGSGPNVQPPQAQQRGSASRHSAPQFRQTFRENL